MRKALVLFLLLLLFKDQVFAASGDGLLMYLPFEGSTANQVTALDGEAKNVNFAEGKIGKGAYFDKGSYLRFPAKGNINYRQGTVEFWVKPNWDGDDGGYHYFFAGNITNAKNINSIHLSKKYYNGGVIMGQIDGPADQQGIGIEEANVPNSWSLNQSLVAFWKKGEWHHLAYSWDTNERILKLYIDGFLRSTTAKVAQLAFPIVYESYIMIGSSIDEVVFAESVIDELKIWNYPLSDMQIAKIAGLSEIGQSTLNKKEFNPFTVLLVIASLGAVLLFWKRNSFSIIKRKGG